MRRKPLVKQKPSYEKGRRDIYGESPHISRRAILRRKADRNRANRHRQALALRQLPALLGDDSADQSESATFHRAPKLWNKIPNKPLRAFVEPAFGRRRRFQTSGGRRRGI